MFVPVNRPSVDRREVKEVLKTLKTGWVSADSPINKEFEKNFSKKINRKHSVAVSSGTAALDIAVKSLNLKKGDEVIVPTFTIISTLSQIVRQGLKPILIDSDPITWNMDVNKIKKKISNRTKAIMVVHIYGIPTEMKEILKLANKYNLYVIEDAAEQLGQTYNGKPIGSFGDISTFSFFANKHITTGEGGMIATNNSKLKDKFKILRNLSFNPKKQKFIHDTLGWNYRMTSLQAAMGKIQLKKLAKFIKIKRNIGNFYNNSFKNLTDIQLPLHRTTYAENIYWVYGLVLKKKKHKALYYIKKLRKLGIECRPFFCPMHLQPVFKSMNFFKKERFPVSENLFNYGFYIPCGIGMKKKELIYVAKMVKKIFK
tara:strand:+ start:21569 stop:22681 length:1113 start_codon:yes stop_codon:yes gene_type:complete